MVYKCLMSKPRNRCIIINPKGSQVYTTRAAVEWMKERLYARLKDQQDKEKKRIVDLTLTYDMLIPLLKLLLSRPTTCHLSNIRPLQTQTFLHCGYTQLSISFYFPFCKKKPDLVIVILFSFTAQLILSDLNNICQGNSIGSYCFKLLKVLRWYLDIRHPFDVSPLDDGSIQIDNYFKWDDAIAHVVFINDVDESSVLLHPFQLQRVHSRTLCGGNTLACRRRRRLLHYLFSSLIQHHYFNLTLKKVVSSYSSIFIRVGTYANGCLWQMLLR